MVSAANLCKSKNRRGQPCGAYPTNGSKFCFWHNAKHGKARAAARSRGGHAKHARVLAVDTAPVEIGDLADVVPLVTRAINDTLVLENSIARNRTLGYLAGVAVTALQQRDVDARLAALEAALRDRR